MKKRMFVLLAVLALVIGCLAVSAFAAPTVAVVHTPDGATNCSTLARAIQICTEGYVQLLQPSAENLTITKNLCIDLNGQSLTGTVTIADGVTVYGKDSQTDDYTVANGVYGKISNVVLDGSAKITGAQSGTAFSDDAYVMVTESGAISFHRLTLKIHTMTLRSDKAGLYYKSDFLGDEKAASMVSQFGVALSVVSEPTADNLDITSKRSIFTGFQSGADANSSHNSSTLLSGVLKNTNTDEANKRNCNMPIYGRAYAKTTDGQFVFGQTVTRNLSQQLTDVDAIVSNLNHTQMTALTAMYSKFISVLQDLNLTNIAKATENQEKGTLKVLVVGNSHGRDATCLLYEVFRTEQPGRKVIIGLLERDGCTISEHKTLMSNNTPLYRYFKNDGTTSNGVAAVQYDVTALTGLQDEQWDVILMQQMSTYMATERHYNSDWKYVADYILDSQEVKPKLGFHMVMATPDDSTYFFGPGTPYGGGDASGWKNMHDAAWGDADGNYDMNVMYETFVNLVQTHLVDSTELMGDNYFDFVMPTATAIHYAHKVLGRPQNELYRDYTHLNDYGRLMAAYLWYAELMGLESISEVNIDAIPNDLAVGYSNQFPTPESGRAVTKDMKDDIIAAVNWTLEHPFTIKE